MEDKDKILARLLRNQDEIGNAIKPYYGRAAGDKLAQLLREHILLAGKVVEAAKANNQADLKKYNAEWYKNADDMTNFLGNANPYLNKQQLRQAFQLHLKMVTENVVARLKKDWDADIRAFDKGEAHLIHIADTITKGIQKQFPKKF
ncbi:glycosyltransferase [Neobacillus pocheonensis]|uniref:glycosyltransferase n=1 Tax=Neobacillus pocheonensis TaxID=363869 RepID=UPI003D26CBD0